MSTKRSKLKSKIKKDKKIVRMVTAIQKLEPYRVDYDALRDRHAVEFSARTYRKIDSNSPHFLDDTMRACVEDNNLRSTLTESLITATQLSRRIDRLIDAAIDYILEHYDTELRAVATTKEERKRFIESAFRVLVNKRRDAESFIVEIKYLIEDVDKAGYGIKNLAELAKSIYRPEARPI